MHQSWINSSFDGNFSPLFLWISHLRIKLSSQFGCMISLVTNYTQSALKIVIMIHKFMLKQHGAFCIQQDTVSLIYLNWRCLCKRTICFDSSFTSYCNIKEDTLQKITFCMQGNVVLGIIVCWYFPKINSFKEFFNKYHIRMSNSLDPNQVKILSVLIWVQTVWKGYQQRILAGKEYSTGDTFHFIQFSHLKCLIWM